MAELSKYFKSSEELTDYLDGGNLPSNVLAVVVEDETVKEMAIATNDIDGEFKTYRVTDEYPTPTGTVNITQNGENIDVKQYATANVNVPQPSGNVNITANGEGVDIAQYATANVNVAGDEAKNAAWIAHIGTENLYELDELIPFVPQGSGGYYSVGIVLSNGHAALVSNVIDSTLGTWILLLPVGGTLWSDLTKFTVEDAATTSPITIQDIAYAADMIGDPNIGVAIRVKPTGDFVVKYDGTDITSIMLL